MSGFDDLTIADLSKADLKTIQRLEKKLVPNIRLVAVENKGVLYVLETKMGPNLWERVDTVYSEIKGIKAYYTNLEVAKEAKGWIKGFLINNNLSPKPQKRPIRIRRMVDTES